MSYTVNLLVSAAIGLDKFLGPDFAELKGLRGISVHYVHAEIASQCARVTYEINKGALCGLISCDCRSTYLVTGDVWTETGTYCGSSQTVSYTNAKGIRMIKVCVNWVC